MKINPGPESIKSLFATEDEVVVPTFQRNYVWKTENVKQLLDDAVFAGETSDTHFFGPIVLLRRKDSLEVIDGQQRVTTVVMTIAILRDMLLDKRYFGPSESPFVNSSSHALNSILYKGTIPPTPKFRAGYLIRELFDQGILPEDGQKTLEVRSKGGGLSPAQVSDTKEVRKIHLFIQKYLRAKLEPLNGAAKQDLFRRIFKGLTENFQIHSMVVENELDAYQLFESINYLGIKLEPGDLLKSLTLKKVQIADPNKLGVALSDWDKFIANLGGFSVSKFLRHYLVAETENKVRASQIFPEFKRIIEKPGSDSLLELSKLAHASYQYGVLLGKETSIAPTPQIGLISKRLNLISETHRILLLMIMQSKLDDNQKNQAFRATEYLTFRTVCARENAQETEDKYRTLGSELKTINSQAELDKWCKALMEGTLSDDNLKDHIVNNCSYRGIQYDSREDLARYVLAVLTDDIDQGWPAVPTLEHLAPQTPATGSNWKTLVGTTADPYDFQIHWWGNLTYLEQSLNSSISNKEWSLKVSGDPEKNIDGLQKSKYLVTARVCLTSSWTSQEIISRGQWMFNTLLSLRSKEWVMTGTNNAKKISLW